MRAKGSGVATVLANARLQGQVKFANSLPPDPGTEEASKCPAVAGEMDAAGIE